MRGRPDLHKVSLSANNLAEAIRELNIHQDRVRLAFAEKRTYLEKMDPAREPLDGELLYSSDGCLYLCMGTEYVKIFPVSKEDKEEVVPDWFLEYVYNLEKRLSMLHVPKEQWYLYGGGI